MLKPVTMSATRQPFTVRLSGTARWRSPRSSIRRGRHPDTPAIELGDGAVGAGDIKGARPEHRQRFAVHSAAAHWRPRLSRAGRTSDARSRWFRRSRGRDRDQVRNQRAHLPVEARHEILVLEFHFEPLPPPNASMSARPDREAVARLAVQIDDLAVEQHAGTAELARGSSAPNSAANGSRPLSRAIRILRPMARASETVPRSAVSFICLPVGGIFDQVADAAQRDRHRRASRSSLDCRPSRR